MAELMQKTQSSVVAPKKGEVYPGKITKITSGEILIDINAKTEAVVLEKDKRILRSLLSAIKVGDVVDAQVLNPESDMGHPVVSLRRFIDTIVWKKLEDEQKKQSVVKATIKEITRGGFLVDTETGTAGFLPNSQVTAQLPNDESSEQLQEWIGKKLDVYVLEVNKATNKIIFSQKPTLTREEFEKAVKDVKVKEKVKTKITTITNFGMFVSFTIGTTQLYGLIHISEISWDKVEDIGSMFTVGQEIDATIIGIDREAKRVDLSIKQLSIDPFEQLSKAFTIDQKVTGTVKDVTPTGVVVTLESPSTGSTSSLQASSGQAGVEGLIRKEKIPPTVTYTRGSKITATVSQIDKKRHRIVLLPVLLEKPIGYR